jgi:hypothetical protein
MFMAGNEGADRGSRRLSGHHSGIVMRPCNQVNEPLKREGDGIEKADISLSA